ncbi:MAG: hypothetical protein M3R51_11040 [Candidatus Eremiobacteraeota bacterium]|nr:hypothetical protein [Candidatus Eremiobacteraeota bacterium]
MDGIARAGIAAVLAAVTLSGPVKGTFALLGGIQEANARMTVTAAAGKTRLDILEKKRGTDSAITAYDVDMTQRMHLILVSDDFSEFRHLHPVLDSTTGRFSIDIALQRGQRYYAYADTKPTALSQQVFRFVIEPNEPNTARRSVAPVFTPSPATQREGAYAIALSSTRLRAGSPSMMRVDIQKNGKPAADLRTYLGAAAHAVYIDTSTLSYVHVHPMVRGSAAMGMDMSGAGTSAMPEQSEAGPRMTMRVPALPIGTYKLWLQFRGGSTLYTAPFTIAVR